MSSTPTAAGQEETVTVSRPTPAVQADATAMVSVLDGLLSAIPHENDIAEPNERERVWNQRRTLNGFRNELKSRFEGRLVKLDRRLPERKNWYQHLTACYIDLEKALIQADGGPNFQLQEELRQSLVLLRDGSEGAHDEHFATPVIRWLAARGFRPDPDGGGFFAAGGLLRAEHDIAELEKERDEIIGQIEATLSRAKEFVASMATPVGETATAN